MPAYSPLIRVKGVSKSFPGGIQALYKVSMEVYPGEVLALLGENGSGKSTLIKILYGIYVPDEGEIFIDRYRAYIRSPRDAIKYGLALVSQSSQLIENLTVLDNVLISLQGLGLFTTRKKILERIRKVSEEFNIRVDPALKVYSLTYTQRQLVEFLKALLLNARVLLIDEALTYLPESGKKELLRFLLDFKSKGNSAILVTHKIPEALEVADRLAILRRGVLVDVVAREEAAADKIRLLMFGTEQDAVGGRLGEGVKPATPSRVVISVEDLSVQGDYGEEAVRGVTFGVRAGEVVGIAGLTGNGQKELVEAIMGIRRVLRGKIYIDDVDVTNAYSHTVRDLGVGFIPDTPVKYGVALDMSILENTALLLSRKEVVPRWDLAKKVAREIISEYSVVASSEHTPVKLLSGGNLMKVVIGRELKYSKRALIAYNPTRNLDEYTSGITRSRVVKKAREEGLAVLYVSEDLDEVLQVSDYVYTMSSGVLYGPFEGGKVERDVIERFMVM